jgi:hypothetical protein
VWTDDAPWASRCQFDVAGSEVTDEGEIGLCRYGVMLDEWGGASAAGAGWIVEVVGEKCCAVEDWMG